jgi:adenosine/AMP kinase
MRVDEVTLEVPDGFQLVLGQSHFIKTVEDLFETLASAMPGLKFGVSFCEASGKALVRFDGTDPGSVELSKDFASRIGAGHSFVVVLRGAFPINVLNRIKGVEEVAGVHCATSNDVTVLVAEAAGGRGVIGVVDGVKPKGFETDEDVRERHDLLRKIGYKR